MGQKSAHYFITGVSSGIGKALTEALCQRGHKVSGLARRQSLLDDLENRLTGFTGYAVDVCDHQAIADAAEQAAASYGAIDVLIPNAGIYQPQEAGHIDLSAFQRHMDVNYMAVIACLAAVLPEMQKTNKGHIALMASVAGYRGLPRSIAYGPTKAAIINLAESLRFDLQNTGIKLQVINPGFVETEATAVNDFVMPDIISADKAALEILAGLYSDKFEIAFPKSFARKMKWLKLLSNDIYFKIVSSATNTKK